MEIYFIYVTFGSLKEAKRLGGQLVKNKLAACTNIIPVIYSTYVWKNKIQNSKEIIICGKTTSENQKKIIQIVKSLHSYSVPCIIFFDIKNGNKDFLKWIKQSVT